MIWSRHRIITFRKGHFNHLEVEALVCTVHQTQITLGYAFTHRVHVPRPSCPIIFTEMVLVLAANTNTS